MKTKYPLRSLLLLASLLLIGFGFQQAGWAAADKASLLNKNGRIQMLRPSIPFAVPGRGILAIGPASGEIEVAVNDSTYGMGNFTIGKPSGGPILLYGHPNPGTGGTTIRVDGTDYWNNSGDIGTAVTHDPPYPYVQGNQSIMKWNVAGGVVLTQTLSLVSSVSGGSLNTVEIRYDIENNDTAAHDVGLRIMLDTMLDNNDGAPFRVPGVGDVTQEVEFTGANMPQYFEVFNDLANPTVQAKGTLSGGNATPPDRMVFAYWRHIVGTPWDFTVDTANYVTSDSALGYYWNPVRMNAGDKKTYITYYGLGQMQVVTQGNFTVALSSYDALTRDSNDALSPNPFQITSYIQNSGNGPITGAAAALTLPAGLELETTVPAQTLNRTIGTLAAGAQVQLTWMVRATDTVRGPLTYTLDVTDSSGVVTSAQVSRQIIIPIPIPTTITAAEYFLDTDPGQGLGTALSAEDGAFDSPSETVRVQSFPLTGLAQGSHTLYIRFKDSLGRWSRPTGKDFSYICNRLITAAEYFVDTDPGEGRGTAMTIPGGSGTVVTVGTQASIVGLPSGAHTLYVRFREQSGGWSSPVGKTFTILACTTGTITGDVGTLAPGYQVGIQGATITLYGTSKTTATIDPSGHFVLTGVADGTYKVVISAPHHQTVEIPNVTVVSGAAMSIGNQLLPTLDSACLAGDADGSGQLGLGDAIYILQTISGSRTTTTP
jgi:hypothetical protein